MYQFLGDVNLFLGRVIGDKAYLGGLAVDLPSDGTPTADVERLYIRPHLLQVHAEPSGTGDFRARVVHVNKAGPIVKVELVAEWGDRVFVEMSPERCLSLNLDTGAEVFISQHDKRLIVRG